MPTFETLATFVPKRGPSDPMSAHDGEINLKFEEGQIPKNFDPWLFLYALSGQWDSRLKQVFIHAIDATDDDTNEAKCRTPHDYVNYAKPYHDTEQVKRAKRSFRIDVRVLEGKDNSHRKLRVYTGPDDSEMCTFVDLDVSLREMEAYKEEYAEILSNQFSVKKSPKIMTPVDVFKARRDTLLASLQYETQASMTDGFAGINGLITEMSHDREHKAIWDALYQSKPETHYVHSVLFAFADQLLIKKDTDAEGKGYLDSLSETMKGSAVPVERRHEEALGKLYDELLANLGKDSSYIANLYREFIQNVLYPNVRSYYAMLDLMSRMLEPMKKHHKPFMEAMVATVEKHLQAYQTAQSEALQAAHSLAYPQQNYLETQRCQWYFSESARRSIAEKKILFTALRDLLPHYQRAIEMQKHFEGLPVSKSDVYVVAGYSEVEINKNIYVQLDVQYSPGRPPYPLQLLKKGPQVGGDLEAFVAKKDEEALGRMRAQHVETLDQSDAIQNYHQTLHDGLVDFLNQPFWDTKATWPRINLLNLLKPFFLEVLDDKQLSAEHKRLFMMSVLMQAYAERSYGTWSPRAAWIDYTSLIEAIKFALGEEVKQTSGMESLTGTEEPVKRTRLMLKGPGAYISNAFMPLAKDEATRIKYRDALQASLLKDGLRIAEEVYPSDAIEKVYDDPNSQISRKYFEYAWDYLTPSDVSTSAKTHLLLRAILFMGLSESRILGLDDKNETFLANKRALMYLARRIHEHVSYLPTLKSEPKGYSSPEVLWLLQTTSSATASENANRYFTYGLNDSISLLTQNHAFLAENPTLDTLEHLLTVELKQGEGKQLLVTVAQAPEPAPEPAPAPSATPLAVIRRSVKKARSGDKTPKTRSRTSSKGASSSRSGDEPAEPVRRVSFSETKEEDIDYSGHNREAIARCVNLLDELKTKMDIFADMGKEVQNDIDALLSLPLEINHRNALVAKSKLIKTDPDELKMQCLSDLESSLATLRVTASNAKTQLSEEDLHAFEDLVSQSQTLLDMKKKELNNIKVNGVMFTQYEWLRLGIFARIQEIEVPTAVLQNVFQGMHLYKNLEALKTELSVQSLGDHLRWARTIVNRQSEGFGTTDADRLAHHYAESKGLFSQKKQKIDALQAVSEAAKVPDNFASEYKETVQDYDQRIRQVQPNKIKDYKRYYHGKLTESLDAFLKQFEALLLSKKSDLNPHVVFALGMEDAEGWQNLTNQTTLAAAQLWNQAKALKAMCSLFSEATRRTDVHERDEGFERDVNALQDKLKARAGTWFFQWFKKRDLDKDIRDLKNKIQLKTLALSNIRTAAFQDLEAVAGLRKQLFDCVDARSNCYWWQFFKKSRLDHWVQWTSQQIQQAEQGRHFAEANGHDEPYRNLQAGIAAFKAASDKLEKSPGFGELAAQAATVAPQALLHHFDAEAIERESVMQEKAAYCDEQENALRAQCKRVDAMLKDHITPQSVSYDASMLHSYGGGGSSSMSVAPASTPGYANQGRPFTYG